METRVKPKLSFSAAERARIRTALLRYMADHKMGAEAIWKLIVQSDPFRREVTRRTLQRFLARAHHTEGSNVSIFYEFVKDFPYFDEGRAADNLCRSLSDFFAVPPVTKEPSIWNVTERLVLDARLMEQKDGGSSRVLPGRDGLFYHLPFSVIVLEPAPHFLDVSEIIPRAPSANASETKPRLVARGVALPIDSRSLFSLCRDTLTRRPRVSIWTTSAADPDDITGGYLGLPEPFANEPGDALTERLPDRLTARPAGPGILEFVSEFDRGSP